LILQYAPDWSKQDLPRSVKTILKCLELDRDDEDAKELKKVRRTVACMEECFDIIHKAHCLHGNLGIERTWTTLSLEYFNITQKMVRAYCATCYICMEKNPVITGFKGAKEAIMSHSWHDHFHMDLINLQKFPRKNIYGVTMIWWLLTIKDHPTWLMAVFAIPRNGKTCCLRIREVLKPGELPNNFSHW
jgi:hypothetical protein